MLINIFKKTASNRLKMNYVTFISALIQIFIKLKPLYDETPLGIASFITEVLYCSQEKECFKKLSNLKITEATPKIQYNKVVFPSGHLKTNHKNIFSQNKEK